MNRTGHNPEKLSPEILAKMPEGARLIRDENERKAFEAESGEKADLYGWLPSKEIWLGDILGSIPSRTYCTTRPLGWDEYVRNPAEKESDVVQAKPPIGIMPERIWKEERVWGLMKCLVRHENHPTVRLEWWDELRRLLDELHAPR